jgi:hypothetical protein
MEIEEMGAEMKLEKTQKFEVRFAPESGRSRQIR